MVVYPQVTPSRWQLWTISTISKKKTQTNKKTTRTAYIMSSWKMHMCHCKTNICSYILMLILCKMTLTIFLVKKICIKFQMDFLEWHCSVSLFFLLWVAVYQVCALWIHLQLTSSLWASSATVHSKPITSPERESARRRRPRVVLTPPR